MAGRALIDKDWHSQQLRGRRSPVAYTVLLLHLVKLSSALQLVSSPVSQLLQSVDNTRFLRTQHPSQLQLSALLVFWWCILHARLLLLLFVLLLVRLPLHRAALRLGHRHGCGTPMQHLSSLQRRPFRELDFVNSRQSRREGAFPGNIAAPVRPQHSCRRLNWQVPGSSFAVMVLLCFVSLSCLFSDNSQRLPAARPLPAAQSSTTPTTPALIRRGEGTTGERENGHKPGGLIILAEASFKSLLPPLSPTFTVNRKEARKSFQLFVPPPTLQLSGADSLYCSCQNKVTPLVELDSTNEGVRHDARKTTTDTQTGTKTDGKENNENSNDSNDTLHEPEDSGLWCCKEDEKQEALRRVFEASDGVAFVSLGDSGQPGKQLVNTAATLAYLSQTVNIRYVNVLGDNFYPYGVYSTSDPLWNSAFDNPFDHAALEKVAFFPVLGNHDYGLNPYAQIERYMRSRAVFTPLTGGAEGRRNPSALGLHLPSSRSASTNAYRAAAMQGVVGDRWRFPNYWYYTRHVFRDVPYSVTNPYEVGKRIYDVDKVAPLRGEGESGDVVVVTIYVDTMVLIADEIQDKDSPYRFSKDELYNLQLAFIESVLREAQPDADWIFICGHHPVITDGNLSRNLPGFSAVMKTLTRKYLVDAYISGHEHLLSLFQGEPDTKTTFIISGAASKQHLPVACLRTSCAFNAAEPGFVLHLLSKTALHHIFVDHKGKVLFTQMQPTQRQDRGAGQFNPLAYPDIRRVYIGPSDQYMGSRCLRFSPYWYFLFGTLAASVCILFLASVLWLLCTFKHRKQAIVSAFRSRLQISQPQPILHDDSEVCRKVLVVSGRIKGPSAFSESTKGRSEETPENRTTDRPQRSEQPSSEAASVPHVPSKSKGSLPPGTFRRSSSRQTSVERKDTCTSSTESQFLLEFSPPLTRHAPTWVRNSLPRSSDTPKVVDQ